MTRLALTSRISSRFAAGRPPRLAAAVLGLALLLPVLWVACGDEQGSFAGVDLPEIRVSPEVVTFDQLAIGESDERVVTVENLGGAELIISGYSWDGIFADFSITGLDGLRLAAGTSRTFQITYAPSNDEADVATLRIDSNAGPATVTVSTLGQAGVLRTEPSIVELMADDVGERTEEVVTVYNAGTEGLELLGVSMISASRDLALAGTDFDVPVTIGVGESVTLTVAYTPTGRGSDEGNLLFEHDGANAVDGSTTVPVIGTLRSPVLEIDPTFVEFGAVPLDETATEPVTLSNTGQATLHISDIYMSFGSSEDMAIVSLDGEAFSPGPYDPPIEIEAGETSILEVAYTPSDGEPDNAAAVVVSDDPDLYMQRIEMGGRLDAPYLLVTPSSLSFGGVASGLRRQLVLVIRNAGSQPLRVDPPQVDSDGSYSIDNVDDFWDSADPIELAADESIDLLVAFSPLGEGVVNGQLTITSPNDTAHSPVVVPMTGWGAGTPYCEITVTPTTINFGLVPRGSAQTGRAIVRNTGPGECVFQNIQLQTSPIGFGGIPLPGFDEFFSDAFSIVRTSLPAGSGTILGPGAHFVVEAQYAPVSFTAFSESPLGDTGSIELTIRDRSSSDTVTCGSVSMFSMSGFSRECGINLQGRSGIAEIEAIPSAVDFGAVTVGCNSQTTTVKVYNIGSAPVTVTDIFLEGDSCSPEFRLAGVPAEVAGPDGYELPSGGAPLELQVRYRPETETSAHCDLVILSDAETASRLVVPLDGYGTNTSHQVDEFEQVNERQVDVLFVVDNSASMSEEQDNLARNFSEFIDVATIWDTDYQIGVITTEPDEEYRGRNPGELVGDPRIIIPSTPGGPEIAFQSNVDVGADGDGARESGLEAAHHALTDPLISDIGDCSDCMEPYACVPNADGSESRCGGYNRSFVREDASLEIVFLSDEPDQSRGSLEFYIDFLKSIKGAANAGLFHAHAIVGPAGGCEGTGGSAEEGLAYLDVADATGGQTGSICDSSFATSMRNIGNTAFGLRTQFFLSRVADPATIRVSFTDGTPMTGWTYDPIGNSIVFDDPPPRGSTFRAEYEARCF